MTTPILTTRSLRKTYGKITALDGLDLQIDRGMVFGLLGPNGSGKSTTLGLVLDVTNSTSGSYQWFGESASHLHRKRIGAILEKPNFYPNYSAIKNLQLVCQIKGVEESRIEEVLETVGLTERKDSSFRTFSLGMKQRLAIASALLADPEVLILDEPTNGLDPQGIAEIRQLIIDISLSGKTIVLASHLLDEVQKVCTHFAILKRGHLIHTGRVDADLGEEVIIELSADDMAALSTIVQGHPAYISHRDLKDRIEVKWAKDTPSSAITAYLVEQGTAPTMVLPIKKTLEQQFMEITTAS